MSHAPDIGFRLLRAHLCNARSANRESLGDVHLRVYPNGACGPDAFARARTKKPRTKDKSKCANLDTEISSSPLSSLLIRHLTECCKAIHRDGVFKLIMEKSYDADASSTCLYHFRR